MYIYLYKEMVKSTVFFEYEKKKNIINDRSLQIIIIKL